MTSLQPFSQDCTIKVWETSQGKLIRELKGHGHWVNTLALSMEYVLRTGPYDYKAVVYSSADEMKEAALARYNAARKDYPERLVSGSDDFTMFLWEPAANKHPRARMTGHQQLVNHVYFSPNARWIASASFDKPVKLWNGFTGEFVATFRGLVYQISWSADSRLLLSGSKDSTLKVSGEITYNGHTFDEFVPQKTCSYVSQTDLHLGEMTVQENLDFSCRCQGVGSKYELLTELCRREKEAGILPDADLDAFMKATAIEGIKQSLQTDYILKLLGLEDCADTIVGDNMIRGVS